MWPVSLSRGLREGLYPGNLIPGGQLLPKIKKIPECIYNTKATSQSQQNFSLSFGFHNGNASTSRISVKKVSILSLRNARSLGTKYLSLVLAVTFRRAQRMRGILVLFLWSKPCESKWSVNTCLFPSFQAQKSVTLKPSFRPFRMTL